MNKYGTSKKWNYFSSSRLNSIFCFLSAFESILLMSQRSKLNALLLSSVPSFKLKSDFKTARNLTMVTNDHGHRFTTPPSPSPLSASIISPQNILTGKIKDWNKEDKLECLWWWIYTFLENGLASVFIFISFSNISFSLSHPSSTFSMSF